MPKLATIDPQPSTSARPNASNMPFTNITGPSGSLTSPLARKLPDQLVKTPTRPVNSQTSAARLFSADRRPSASLSRPSPASSAHPLSFIPSQKATSSKLPVYKQSNKVPVYKQKASTIFAPPTEKRPDDKPSKFDWKRSKFLEGDDAFSFTDDEEEDSKSLSAAIAKAPIQNFMSPQIVDEESPRKSHVLPVEKEPPRLEPKVVAETFIPIDAPVPLPPKSKILLMSFLSPFL